MWFPSFFPKLPADGALRGAFRLQPFHHILQYIDMDKVYRADFPSGGKHSLRACMGDTV